MFSKKDKSELSRTRVNRMVIFRTCLVKMNVLGTVHFAQIKKISVFWVTGLKLLGRLGTPFFQFLLLVFLDRNTS